MLQLAIKMQTTPSRRNCYNWKLIFTRHQASKQIARYHFSLPILAEACWFQIRYDLMCGCYSHHSSIISWSLTCTHCIVSSLAYCNGHLRVIPTLHANVWTTGQSTPSNVHQRTSTKDLNGNQDTGTNFACTDRRISSSIASHGSSGTCHRSKCAATTQTGTCQSSTTDCTTTGRTTHGASDCASSRGIDRASLFVGRTCSRNN